MESDAAANEIEQILNLLIGEGVVAYQRGLARAIGCHSAGLLLSQFWYWTQRLPEGRDGWFHKTMPEIEQETVMGRREQDSARKKLRDLGLLEERKQGQPAKLWFRLNRRGVVELLRQDARERGKISLPEPSLQSDLQFGGKRQTRLAESAKQGWRNAPNKVGGMRQTNKERENTTKTTAKSTTTTGLSLEAEGLFAVAAGGEKVFPESLEENLSAPDEALVTRLVEAGVGKMVARRLAAQMPEECQRQLEFLPFAAEIKSTPGAYLRSAIEQGFSPPKGFEEAGKRKKLEEVKQAQKREVQRQGDAQAERRAQIESRRRIVQEGEPERWSELLRQAGEQLPILVRSRPQSPMYQAALMGKVDELIEAGASENVG